MTSDSGFCLWIEIWVYAHITTLKVRFIRLLWKTLAWIAKPRELAWWLSRQLFIILEFTIRRFQLRLFGSNDNWLIFKVIKKVSRVELYREYAIRLLLRWAIRQRKIGLLDVFSVDAISRWQRLREVLHVGFLMHNACFFLHHNFTDMLIFIKRSWFTVGLCQMRVAWILDLVLLGVFKPWGVYQQGKAGLLADTVIALFRAFDTSVGYPFFSGALLRAKLWSMH